MTHQAPVILAIDQGTTSTKAFLLTGDGRFLSCGGLEMHGDFMTRAWGQDPLAQALTMIPGYPQTAQRIRKTS